MSKPEVAYYEHYKRQHLVFGAYLAIHCWHNRFDAVIVPRDTLVRFHEIQKFTTERLNWLKADVHPYFPHFSKFIFAKNKTKFAAVTLSRIPIPQKFETGSMANLDRARYSRADGFQVAAFDEIPTIPKNLTERDAATFLALMTVGLAFPGSPTPVPRT